MKNMTPVDSLFGYGGHGLWPVSSLGWSLKVKVNFLLPVATSSLQWSPLFSWTCGRLAMWRWSLRVDVRDPFLTFQQKCPTLVRTTDASGNSRSCAPGRMLPGQRDGSLLWYKAITNFLKQQHLDFEEHAPYPCVFKSQTSSCIVMIHVAYLLVAGRCSFVFAKQF